MKMHEKGRKGRHHYPEWLDPATVDAYVDRYESIAQEPQYEQRVFTGMPSEALESFLETGEYKTFWQTGPTWHTKYHPAPHYGREFNDMRLYAQKALKTVYGVLLPEEGNTELQMLPRHYGYQEDIKNYLRSHSGTDEVKIIQWKPQVLQRYTTFCYGDSQQNAMVFEYSRKRHEALDKLLYLLEYQRGHPLFNVLLEPKRNPYYEVQMHEGVTPEDIQNVE
jgi:hypothetical protein